MIMNIHLKIFNYAYYSKSNCNSIIENSNLTGWVYNELL